MGRSHGNTTLHFYVVYGGFQELLQRTARWNMIRVVFGMYDKISPNMSVCLPVSFASAR